MTETGQRVRRAVAALQKRETLRIAAPVAAAVVIAGVLLSVFLPGGPESDEPSEQTVDIAERADEATADGGQPADDATAEASASAASTPDAQASGETADAGVTATDAIASADVGEAGSSDADAATGGDTASAEAAGAGAGDGSDDESESTAAGSEAAQADAAAQGTGDAGDGGEAEAQAPASGATEGSGEATSATAAEGTGEGDGAATAQSQAAAEADDASGSAEQTITEARVDPDEAVEATSGAGTGEVRAEGGSTATEPATAAAPAEESGDGVIPPSFDTVRIKPDGSAVFAGRAEPGAEVTVLNGSEEIGSETADRRGEWVLLPVKPIPPGDHELSLVETLPDGRQVESEQVLVLSVPDPEAGEEERSALAVLVPRDGGGGKVLQKPTAVTGAEDAPEAEKAIDVARLTDPEAGEALPDATEPGAAAESATASAEALAESGEPSPGAPGDGEATADPAPQEVEDEGSLVVATVDYDETGDMTIAGQAEPDTDLNVYLDEEYVGTVEADEEGEWEVETEAEVEPGSYTLRIDQVDETGIVLARIETPLIRARPELLTFGDAIVVVQPGNSLWRIARRTLGGGVHFTEIYEANRSQIGDPALIYPGQIFTLPEVGGG